jgi:light-regulated signal transduction histidine kinase (bacteriophytochrome)
MQSTLNRMNLLLEDILSLSAASFFNDEFTTVSLNDIINNVLTTLRPKIAEKQAKIEVSPLPSIFGSKQMLESLFSNIIDNSLKFQLPDNIPHIKITNCVAPAENNTGKDLLCISISDNGIGFYPEDKEKIFRMFERLNSKRKFHGSGIGLTVCRKIAEAHDGYIEAESEPRIGTTIKCYLAIS